MMVTAALDDEPNSSEDLDLLPPPPPKPLAQHTKPERGRVILWLILSSSSYANDGIFLVATCIDLLLGFLCVALFSHNEMSNNLRTQPLTQSAVPEQVTNNFTFAPPNNSFPKEWFRYEMNKAQKDEKKATFQPFESFNHTNPHQNSWCPIAACNNSPLCHSLSFLHFLFNCSLLYFFAPAVQSP